MPRIPVLRALHPSPFEGLLQHANKVKECIDSLGKVIEKYSEGAYEESEKLSEEIINLEHEADKIKSKVSQELPLGIFLPVDKKDFLQLLYEQDAILNFAEDAVIWLHMKKTPIPEDIKEGLLDHLNRVLDCVRTLEVVVTTFSDLILHPSREKKKEVDKLIQEVHRKEWEDDRVGRELARKIFSSSLDFLSIYHLLRFSDLIGSIATHAENAADRISTMLAR